MKKSIKDLTEKDCIATPTKEAFIAVKKLFPDIDLMDSYWECHKEKTCIRPLGRCCLGEYCDLPYYKSQGNPIHSLTDFIESEPPFNPKLGDLVRVPNSNQPRIFLFKKDGKFHCVCEGSRKYFEDENSYQVAIWDNIYPYTPAITLTHQQAIKQLRQLPEYEGKEIEIDG